jgi:hypothetical protein
MEEQETIKTTAKKKITYLISNEFINNLGVQKVCRKI